MKAPFPWAGGKSRVAGMVWQRFGDVPNYVEPFFGSGAVLLGRPFPARVETVNDADCYLANFWRALQHEPEAVAHYADWPVNEADLHARHLWLVNQPEFRERTMSEPDYYDAKIAGWWVWGLSAWIGKGWCSQLEIHNQRPHLAGGKAASGMGVHRGNLVEGVPIQIPHLRDNGKGVNRPIQLPHLQGDSGAAGQGVNAGYVRNDLQSYMAALSNRLRRVRVCCGDWTRIMGRSVTYLIGVTGVFLDPPYSDKANRQSNLYAVDSEDIAHDAREWCVQNGDNPKLRIALCGYDGEHNELEAAGWDVATWKANGGYGNQRKNGTNENAGKERIWFSPHCLNPLDDILTGKKGHDVDINDFEKMPLFAGKDPA